VIRALLETDLLRFGIVSVLGLGFDLSTAWGLAVFVGIPLPAAAFVGFVVGATVNYVLHEIWTFRVGTPGLSTRRWLLYATCLCLTLATRIAVVALLERLVFTAARQEFPTLVAATGISFAVNYILSKYLVFRSETPAPERVAK
jgi:putative flippase GtrA